MMMKRKALVTRMNTHPMGSLFHPEEDVLAMGSCPVFYRTDRRFAWRNVHLTRNYKHDITMIPRQALLVGINDYDGASLKGCVNDAAAMAAMLDVHANGADNFEVKLELNIRRKADLLERITQLFRLELETVLFYFAGHGLVNERGGYIVTGDTRRYNEGISMTELLGLANASKSINKIIILDCCYSGAMGHIPLLPEHTSLIGSGVTILTSSRHDEAALERSGHGVFTRLLLEGLNGAAASVRGEISPAALYAYIDGALSNFEQRPTFKTNVTRFLSLRNATPVLQKETIRSINTYFPEPEFLYKLDSSYEETNTPDYQYPFTEPYAVPEHVTIFKELQKMYRAGLVQPVGATHMFDAAMESQACRLTALGSAVWRQNKRNEPQT